MLVNRFQQITGPSVVKKEDPLPHTPEGSSPKLIRPCGALRDAVRKSSTHVVDKEIREKIHRLVG